jgi:XapX domain-containing protein
VNYKELLYALVTGTLVGFLFAKFKLPVPAPPTLAGILGIVGITLGYVLGKR